MKKIQQILNNGDYPIVHLSKQNKYCPDCYSSDNSHCTHFVVITSLDLQNKTFNCRLVTKSPCCENVKLTDNEYSMKLFKSHLKFKYISSSDETFTIDCLNNTEVSSYFKYLP